MKGFPMIQSPQQLLAHAMGLPSGDRGRLAALLIDSLEPDVDDNADQAWADEIRHRVEDFRTGQVQLVPWAEVRRRMRGPDESSD